MPEFTKEDTRRYKQNIVDIGKANNQVGYLYNFYRDGNDNIRFLRTKCYYARNDQIEGLFKRKYDVMHIVYKDNFGLYDTTCYSNRVDSVNTLFLLEANDELARQMIMEKLEERKLKIINQMSVLASISLETSKTDDKYFDTI